MELIERLNDLKIEQIEVDWAESLPMEIWEKHFDGKFEEVDKVDEDSHRWYELITTVIKLEDKFIGIRHISMMYSESSSVDDIGHILQFMEMEPILKTTYKIKNQNK